MDKLRLEKLYEEKGIYDYKLETIEQLCEVHNVKMNQIYGYMKLKEKDKELFREFLINYYNSNELECRNIIPLRIFRALEEEYVINDFKVSGEIVVVKRLIYKMLNNNSIELCEQYVENEYEDREVRLGCVFSYLYFVCVKNGRHICIHIKDKDKWY